MRRRPADCDMPVDGVSFQKYAGYEGDSSDLGRVEPEERVYGTVTLTTSSRDKLWRVLSCSLSASRWLVS